MYTGANNPCVLAWYGLFPLPTNCTYMYVITYIVETSTR